MLLYRKRGEREKEEETSDLDHICPVVMCKAGNDTDSKELPWSEKQFLLPFVMLCKRGNIASWQHGIFRPSSYTLFVLKRFGI